MEFQKCSENPILKPNPKNAWESLCVLNPAVIYKEDERLFYMIYRAAGNDETHYIYLGLATSEGWHPFHPRQRQEPLLELQTKTGLMEAVSKTRGWSRLAITII
jgi:predicted GH43/DUF377 family glycosyl hydrolase